METVILYLLVWLTMLAIKQHCAFKLLYNNNERALVEQLKQTARNIGVQGSILTRVKNFFLYVKWK